MILPLRLIGGFNPFFDPDPNLVNEMNFPITLICILCLFIAYYKAKTIKYDFSIDGINQDSKEKLRFQSYDVLMQPKGDYDNFSLINKRIKYFSYKKAVVGFLIFLFYYLLFTGKI